MTIDRRGTNYRAITGKGTAFSACVAAESTGLKTRHYKNIGSVSGAFAEFDGNVHFFAAAIDRHGDIVAGALVVEDEVDVELIRDFLAVDGHDDVATDGDPAHACFRDAIAMLMGMAKPIPAVVPVGV